MFLKMFENDSIIKKYVISSGISNVTKIKNP